jgi:hypothetical protein
MTSKFDRLQTCEAVVIDSMQFGQKCARALARVIRLNIQTI